MTRLTPPPRPASDPQVVTNLLQGLSQFPVALYIAVFARSISDQFAATVTLALFNGSATVGQIILGHLTDKFSFPSVMFGSALGCALSAFLLWGFANAPTYLYFFAIIFGTLVRPDSSPLRVLCRWRQKLTLLFLRRAEASPRRGHRPRTNVSEAAVNTSRWRSLGRRCSRVFRQSLVRLFLDFSWRLERVVRSEEGLVVRAMARLRSSLDLVLWLLWLGV